MTIHLRLNGQFWGFAGSLGPGHVICMSKVSFGVVVACGFEDLQDLFHGQKQVHRMLLPSQNLTF